MLRVLIIGATSAIAADVARLYAERGARLALVARDPEKLGAVVASVPGDAVVFEASHDFTDYDGNAGLVAAAIAALGGGLDIALVAHGYLGDQLATEADFAEAERTIAANFTSVVSFVIPLANALEAQGHGHLAVLSSVAGERGRPRNYTYGAAKGAVTTYLQGVRSRLWPAVQVHTVKLGPVVTPMTETHDKNRAFIDSPTAARGIVRAIDKGIAEPFVPRFWGPVMALVERMPEPLFQRLRFLSGR
jgi:decaprenylphospho-beta-D-erythro-pentofuranosid-2-ulose 2-reductase